MDKLIENENATRILQSLQEGPKTIIQLASATNIPERQVRSAMNFLVDSKYVLKAGFYNRSQLWRVNSAVATGYEEFSGRLPYHDLKITGGSANLVDITLSAIVKCSPVPPKGTVTQIDYYSRMLYLLLAEYLNEVNQFAPDMDRVHEIRSELLQAYKVLNSTTDLLKQILAYKDYWTLAGITTIKEAPLIQNSSAAIDQAASTAESYIAGGDPVGNLKSVPN